MTDDFTFFQAPPLFIDNAVSLILCTMLVLCLVLTF